MADPVERPTVQSPSHAVAERSLAARTRAIWLGFGLLLGFIAAGFVYSYISVRNLQAMNAQTRAESRERDQLLDRLANGIYRTANIARDYLLEEDDRQAENYRM